MTTWEAPLDAPPVAVQAWCRVAWPQEESRHHLRGLWQLHVYHHAGRLEVDHRGVRTGWELAPGAVSLLPPDTASAYRLAGRPRFSCLHLALAPGAATPAAGLVAGDALAASLVEEAAAAGEPARAAALAWA
ncbi:MAG: hypothetical protein L6R48_21485, partial [Planctomycetes bacterium]|nr:hypothetical protein [Planctomycetota bacterium]